MPSYEQELAITKRYDRSRSILDYNALLDERWLDLEHEEILQSNDNLLMEEIEDVIARRGVCVWADLGCGNGVALREAKLCLDKHRDKLITYGIDLLLPNPSQLRRASRSLIPEWKKGRLDDAQNDYIFLRESAETVVLPVKPDIITAAMVLRWARDPLRVVSNALAQLSIGGMLGVNDVERVNLAHEDNDVPLGTYLAAQTECAQPLSALACSTLLRKIDEAPNVSDRFVLIAREPYPITGFSFTYALRGATGEFGASGSVA